MRSHVRLAILECDTPLNGTRAKYGNYTGVFTALLHAAADALGVPRDTVSFTGWDVVEKGEYPDLQDIDAVLITGSKYSAYESAPWNLRLIEFVKMVLEQRRVRLVGVCYGHQIVARAMGIRVARNEKGWETSVYEMQPTEKGKEVFGKDTLSLHQMHRDNVYEYPPGVEGLSSTPKCLVHDMYIKGRFITVQGHPEFTQEIVTELVESRHQLGIFDDETYEDAMARVGREHDGVVVAKAFLKFLLEE